MSLERLAHWFEDYVCPFLDSYAEGRSIPLAKELHRWRELSKAPEEVVICFLGNAGIGKSTLINALVSPERAVLPSGGIGPLTAQATSVRYSERPFFRAKYHPIGLLWRLIFPLEIAIARSSDEAKDRSDSAAIPDIDERDLGSDDLSEVLKEAQESASSEDGRLDALIKQAKILVTSNQFSTVQPPYLADCLRLAIGKPRRFDSTPVPDDEKRLARLKAALEFARKDSAYQAEQAGDVQQFLRDLKDHTAGHLAPLLREIEVGWPAALLHDHLVLVDLPGVGIASDAHKKITQEYVRSTARAIIVVIDRAGLTETVVDLLRNSGYWDRVVGAAYEPGADPCTLMIAVTKVDDVAEEEWSNLPDEQRSATPKSTVFAGQVEAMRTQIRAQTADQLQHLQSTAGVSDSVALAKAREAAVGIILEQLEVFPVSAPELRRVVRRDATDPPRIAREASDTQVPQLSAALANLARGVRDRREKATNASEDRFTRGVWNELAIVEEWWKGEAHAAQEAEQLRNELDQFMVPLREQQANRQGGFREFLQGQDTTVIPALVREARNVAEKEIRQYLRELRSAHWGTLRAAVRRGGAWNGARHIDLPNDLSVRFQEPVAGVWGIQLLRPVRQRTTEHAEATVRQVDEIFAWATKRGVNVELLKHERERIADKADQLKEVGKEAADELRNVVKSELYQRISKRISRECEEFVDRGDAIGPGVKQRILDLFDDLASDSAKAAEPIAQRILSRRFNEVRQQVDEAFAEWKDPLRDAADAIAATHEQRVRRADVKKRKEVFARLEAVRKNAPDAALGVDSSTSR